MKNLLVSRRYARAVFQIGQATESLDDILQALGNLCGAVNALPELKKVMASPLIKPDEVERLAKSVTSNKLVLKFVGLLAKRRRLHLIPAIYEELSRLSDASKGIKRVLVKSAVDLSEFDKRLIEKHLMKFWGGEVVGHFRVDKDLVGGISMQMGDKVMDMSLRRRFDDLRRHLVHSSN